MCYRAIFPTHVCRHNRLRRGGILGRPSDPAQKHRASRSKGQDRREEKGSAGIKQGRPRTKAGATLRYDGMSRGRTHLRHNLLHAGPGWLPKKLTTPNITRAEWARKARNTNSTTDFLRNRRPEKLYHHGAKRVLQHRLSPTCIHVCA
jgi:hypothetical protein